MRNTIIILCFMSIVQYSSQQEISQFICIGDVVGGANTETVQCHSGKVIHNTVVGSADRLTSKCHDSYANNKRYCFDNPPISADDCHGKTECQVEISTTQTSIDHSACNTQLTLHYKCTPTQMYTPICNQAAMTPHPASVNYIIVQWDSSLYSHDRCTTSITPPSGYKLKIQIDDITGVFYLCEMSHVVTIQIYRSTGCQSSKLDKMLTKILDAPLKIDVDFSQQDQSKILFQISAVTPPAPTTPSTVRLVGREINSDRGRRRDNSSTAVIAIAAFISTVAVIVGVVLIFYITRRHEKVYTIFAGLRNLRRQRRGNQRAERNVYSAAHTGLRAPTHIRRVPSVSLLEAGRRGRSIVSMRLPAPPPERPEQLDHETAESEMDNASQANNPDLEPPTGYYNMSFTDGVGLSDFDVPESQAPPVPLSNTSSESSLYSLQDFTLLKHPYHRYSLPPDAERVVLPLPARRYSTDSDISVEPDTPIPSPTDGNHFTTSDKSDQPSHTNMRPLDKENVEYTGVVIGHNLLVRSASLPPSKQQGYLETDNAEEPVTKDTEDKKRGINDEQEEPVTYAIIDKERTASMKSKTNCDNSHLDPLGGDSETPNVCLNEIDINNLYANTNV